MKIVSIVILATLLLTSCSHKIIDYKQTEPVFVIEDYFNGELIAHGIVQDYTDKLTRHFCVEMSARWQMNKGILVGTLDEQFYFDDGERQTRIWTIEKHIQQGESYYTGTATDVFVPAYGESQGNAFQWQYQLPVAIKNDDGSIDEYTFDVDDWLFMINDDHVFNRSKLIKFGLTVGEISLFFDKKTPHKSCG